MSLREVTSRTVNQGAGGFTNSHALSHDDGGDAGRTYHYYTLIHDNGAATSKIYYNQPAATGSSLIAPWIYQEYQYYATVQKNFAYGQNGAGNTYPANIYNVLYDNTNYAYTFTAQTVDNYGNLTQQQVWDYGQYPSSPTPTRTYNLTYLTDSNYTSRYIRNRLTSASVTQNNIATGLAGFSYDNPTIGQNQYPKNNQGQQVYTTQHDSAYDINFIYRGNVTYSNRMGSVANYAYDTGGNPYLAQDGDGMTISLSTDGSTNGSLPATLTPNGNTNLMTSLTYSSAYTLASVTGANGANQSQANDPYGRPGTVKSVDGGTTTYSYTYGPNTQTASTTVSNPTLNCTQSNNCSFTTSQTSTSSSNLWKKTTYDGFGRVIQVQNGHDSTVLNTVDTVYGPCACSPLGKAMKVSLPYGPGETEVWTTYTYDASGRQLTSTAPDGSVTTTKYTENTVTTTDPAGIWKTNTMDAFGNIVSVQEPDPANLGANGPLTTYTYNGANQLVGVAMTRGTVTQTRSFTYSGSDLISETTPEAGTVAYTYDQNHHVTQRTDAKGQQTQYSYDSYERLTEVRHYTPTGTNNSLVEDLNQRVDYYYDTPVASDYQQQYTWGRLSAVASTKARGVRTSPMSTPITKPAAWREIGC